MFEGIIGSVYLSLIAFTTVFFILVLLSLIMVSFKYIFAREKKSVPKTLSDKTIVKEEEESPFVFSSDKSEDEEVAVVMAAIYSYLGAKRSYYKINFVRRISPDVKFWKHSYKLLRRR